MAIAKVQEVSSYSASGGSSNKTVTISAPTAGNTLVLLARNANNGSAVLSSVTGGGVTWSSQAAFNSLALWVGANSSGSGTTITVTVPNTYERWALSVTEWSGMPTTITADGGSNASTANPNNVTPSVTPTASPCLLLALIRAPNGWSAGPTGGFTDIPVTGGPSTNKFAYQIADPASGSYQAGWTNNIGYSSANAGLYAFTGSSGGGGQDVPELRGLFSNRAQRHMHQLLAQ